MVVINIFFPLAILAVVFMCTTRWFWVRGRTSLDKLLSIIISILLCVALTIFGAVLVVPKLSVLVDDTHIRWEKFVETPLLPFPKNVGNMSPPVYLFVKDAQCYTFMIERMPPERHVCLSPEMASVKETSDAHAVIYHPTMVYKSKWYEYAWLKGIQKFEFYIPLGGYMEDE